MPGNTFGQAFRVTTFGESHGPALGVVVDGCPPGSRSTLDEISARSRPAPARAELTTPRQEAERVEIRRALFEGLTLGTPIALLVRNAGRAAERLRAHARTSTGLARRLHQRGEVRHPQLAGRRPRERARDDRPRRGGRDRAQAARARSRTSRCSPGCSACSDLEAKVDAGDGDARGRSRRTPVRCPDPDAAARDGRRIDAARAPRRLARRRGRVRRARRAGRPRRAGLRQARGRPRARRCCRCPRRRASRSAAASPARA